MLSALQRVKMSLDKLINISARIRRCYASILGPSTTATAAEVATSSGRDVISGRERRDVTCVERVERGNCEFSRRQVSRFGF